MLLLLCSEAFNANAVIKFVVLYSMPIKLLYGRVKMLLNMQGNDPSCLREFLLPILCRNSPSGNAGLQVIVHLVHSFPQLIY